MKVAILVIGLGTLITLILITIYFSKKYVSCRNLCAYFSRIFSTKQNIDKSYSETKRNEDQLQEPETKVILLPR